MAGTARVAQVQLRRASKPRCANRPVLRRSGGALPIFHRQRLLAFKDSMMSNEGIPSRGRSVSAGRRGAKLVWLATFGVAMLAAGAASAQGNLKIGVINVA